MIICNFATKLSIHFDQVLTTCIGDTIAKQEDISCCNILANVTQITILQLMTGKGNGSGKIYSFSNFFLMSNEKFSINITCTFVYKCVSPVSRMQCLISRA